MVWWKEPCFFLQSTWEFFLQKFKINSLSPKWCWISYQSHILVSLKTFHISCLLFVEFCQVLLTLVERFIMLPRSKSHTRHIYVLLLYWKYAKICFSSTLKCSAPTLEDKNMFARFYQNKCSKFSIIFLSKVVVKKDMGYAKYKRWTQKRSKVKRRKRTEMRKDSPCSRKNIP